MASSKLSGVHPDLVAKADQIQRAMDVLGFPMVVTAGRRTAAEQAALFAQGRTKPGPNVRPGHPLGDTVTNADGVAKKSNHQVKSDGWGHAIDMAFVDAHGNPSWAEHYPWSLYGAMGKALGLEWGGDWKSIHDR